MLIIAGASIFSDLDLELYLIFPLNATCWLA